MNGGIVNLGNMLSLAGGAGLLGFARWLMTRHADAITEFRKALDRGLRRENALATLCEMQLYVIRRMDEPPPEVRELQDRAIAVLELAQRQIYGGEK